MDRALRDSAASAPIVANVAAREQAQVAAPTSVMPVDPQSPTTGTTHGAKRALSSGSSVSVLAARQKLLDEHLLLRDLLLEKLNTATAEEKKYIYAQPRKLGQDIKASSTQTAFTPSKKPGSSAPRPEDREAKERERLDKELQLQSAAFDGEETEALQAKLAKLKAEAAILCIDSLAESAPAFS